MNAPHKSAPDLVTALAVPVLDAGAVPVLVVLHALRVLAKRRGLAS